MNDLVRLPVNTAVTAFDQQRLVARGELVQVLDIVTRYEAREAGASVVIFVDASGATLDRDALVLAAAPASQAWSSVVSQPEARRRPGRPRLGVVAREVTLLPEHWRWLATQTGGASAVLRRLIDEARAEQAERERRRQAHGAAWQCLATLGLGLTGVDDALMAIYTGDLPRFEQSSLTWPLDVRDYLRDLGFGVQRDAKSP